MPDQPTTDSHLAGFGVSGWGMVGWLEAGIAGSRSGPFGNVVRVRGRVRSGDAGGVRETPESLVWAICPRCGFKYKLNEMREEIYDQRGTGRRVCPECRDQDDPHLAISRTDLTDIGWVRNPLPHNDQKQSVGMSSPLRKVYFGHPVQAVFGGWSAEVGGVMVAAEHKVVLRETGEGGERFLNSTDDGNWIPHWVPPVPTEEE